MFVLSYRTQTDTGMPPEEKEDKVDYIASRVPGMRDS
jgi:hypothetical protein